MPGYSLWLVPPANTAVTETLKKLINDTIPSLLAPLNPSPPSFVPHVTITSDIETDTIGSDPQAWIDSIPFPESPVRTRFESLAVGTQWTKKLFIRTVRDDLQPLAAACRWAAVLKGDEASRTIAHNWSVNIWDPHVSLLYSDLKLNDGPFQNLEGAIVASGLSFSEENKYSGWEGGSVWLVPTFRAVDQWIPVARRDIR